MFHVEPWSKSWLILVIVPFLFYSCGPSRSTMQISDYILQPNGKEIVGNKGLSAFIFENKRTKISLEQFLSTKFKTDNYGEHEFWVTIQKDKYKIIIYDEDEFEKYFNSANYTVMNVVSDDSKQGDHPKFIAISMINAYNEDCLANDSLFQSVAVNYFKKLKDEYLY